jgi:hypothetical protein
MNKRMGEAMREAAKTLPPQGMGDTGMSPEDLRRAMEQMQKQMRR